MSADNAYAVELKGLTFKRGARSIFNNVDIRIPRGKVTGIMGPSGCGKTTLLRLMGAQLRPSSGEVWVNGQNLPSLSRSDLFDARKHMGVLVRLIRLLNDALGITSIVVSHDLAETASIADYI
jgi:phospholipid/cholesterol/gamma-HCH transport system ATP-binding protein